MFVISIHTIPIDSVAVTTEKITTAVPFGKYQRTATTICHFSEANQRHKD